jgi:hypothetical protein
MGALPRMCEFGLGLGSKCWSIFQTHSSSNDKGAKILWDSLLTSSVVSSSVREKWGRFFRVIVRYFTGVQRSSGPIIHELPYFHLWYLFTDRALESGDKNATSQSRTRVLKSFVQSLCYSLYPYWTCRKSQHLIFSKHFTQIKMQASVDEMSFPKKIRRHFEC